MTNSDDTVSIGCDGKFLSAQLNQGRVIVQPHNREWEHFTLERAEFDLTPEFITQFMLDHTRSERTLSTTNERRPKQSSHENVPAISIVMPMFNSEKYIEECLTSILEQTFGDYEVIVVDDCSTDRSATIVESMQDRFDGRLKLIRLDTNNGEPGTPRNIGINHAVGEYIYFVDSDDILIKNALEILNRTAEQTKADVIHVTKRYNIHRSDNSLEPSQPVLKDSQYIKALTVEPYDILNRLLLFRKVYYRIEPYHHFVRRTFLSNHGIVFAPTFVFDDTFFALHCMFHAKTYVHVPDAVYIYRRVNNNSITMQSRSFEEYIAAQIHSLKLVFNLLRRTERTTKILSENLRYRYMTYRYFFHRFADVYGYVRHYYTSNALSALNATVYNDMSDGAQLPDSLIAYMLSIVDSQSERLKSQDRQLETLRSELERLK